MAGKPGRSGGSRPNTGGSRPNTGGSRPNTGGARPGAGRKKKEAGPVVPANDTSLEFIKSVMNDESQDIRIRLRAAIAAAQYEHVKIKDGGKKEAKEEAAKTASAGRFTRSAPPKLKVVNGK